MTTSILEALNTDRTVADKARFVDYFVGDSLKSWWTETDIQGSNSIAPLDEIDGGFRITSGGVNNDRVTFDHNDKRQFSQTASAFQTTVRGNGTQGTIHSGLADAGFDPNGTSSDCITAWRHPSNPLTLRTNNGTTDTNTQTVIEDNNQWNYFKGELFTSSGTLDVNAILRATSTTNLPNTRLQPMFSMVTGTASSMTADIRYLECWNT